MQGETHKLGKILLFLVTLAGLLAYFSLSFQQDDKQRPESTVTTPEVMKGTKQKGRTATPQPIALAPEQTTRSTDTEVQTDPELPAVYEGLPPSSEYKAKLVRLTGLKLIADPRMFIDQNGMNDLTSEETASLGLTLQFCGSDPIRDGDAMASLQAEMYGWGVRQSTMRRKMEECAPLTDEEIYASYQILREAAEDGNRLALVALLGAVPQEMLQAQIYNQPPPITTAQYDAQYKLPLIELLEASVAAGNVGAAGTLSSIYWESQGEREHRDLIRALAYAKAVVYAEDLAASEPYLMALSDKLFFHEIDEADLLAVEILEQWATLDTLTH